MEAQSSKTQKTTALVVDDTKMHRTIHQKMLQKAGVDDVVVAENGQQAVDIHMNGQRFDLILMDRDMPIMDGVEATKRLRSMGVGSTIVGVSSQDSEVKIQNFMEAGINHYEEKPLKNATLISILDQVKANPHRN